MKLRNKAEIAIVKAVDGTGRYWINDSGGMKSVLFECVLCNAPKILYCDPSVNDPVGEYVDMSGYARCDNCGGVRLQVQNPTYFNDLAGYMGKREVGSVSMKGVSMDIWSKRLDDSQLIKDNTYVIDESGKVWQYNFDEWMESRYGDYALRIETRGQYIHFDQYSANQAQLNTIQRIERLLGYDQFAMMKSKFVTALDNLESKIKTDLWDLPIPSGGVQIVDMIRGNEYMITPKGDILDVSDGVRSSDAVVDITGYSMRVKFPSDGAGLTQEQEKQIAQIREFYHLSS